MKKGIQLAFTLFSLFYVSSSSFAGGVEMSPPTHWDFYIGGSGVLYGYEYRLNSAISGMSTVLNDGPSLGAPGLTKFSSTAGLWGFDVGVGGWVERGYFGIEGRYDIGRIPATAMTGVFPATGFLGEIQESDVYSTYMSKNASIIAKIGYQLWPRTMSYILLGWVRTTAQLSLRIFGPPDGNDTETHGTVAVFESQIYKKSWNGGTVGLGISHLLVDGLSAFAEFAIAGYHIPIDLKFSSISYLSISTPFFTNSTSVLNLNYYYYSLRVGLNWSFASLI